MENKVRYLSLLSSIKRPGIEKLIEWLETTDFFSAPASSRFHGSSPGMLCKHSLNVYDEQERLLSIYPEIEISDESRIICPLVHDFCKINTYQTEKRNRKNQAGEWESYDAYTIKEKFCYGGHGSKSVFLVQSFIPLKPEEAVAINCHMSAFSDDPRSVGGAFSQHPYAWLLSVADQSATYILEREEN